MTMTTKQILEAVYGKAPDQSSTESILQNKYGTPAPATSTEAILRAKYQPAADKPKPVSPDVSKVEAYLNPSQPANIAKAAMALPTEAQPLNHGASYGSVVELLKAVGVFCDFHGHDLKTRASLVDDLIAQFNGRAY